MLVKISQEIIYGYTCDRIEKDIKTYFYEGKKKSGRSIKQQMWKSKFFSKKDIWKVKNYVRTLKILATPTFQRIAKLIMADFLRKRL